MGLLETWRKRAYDEKANKGDLQKLWADYFNKEKEIYAELLKTPDEEVKGTVKELAEKYNTSIDYIAGFLDGIQESLVEPNAIENDLTEDSVVSLNFDNTKLYQNMVAAGADWLYNLEGWDAIFTKDEQHELYLEQKKSGTITKGVKIYPNDPCPCGSGKKYKKCHGRNVL